MPIAMLKAILLTTIAGLVSARLPVLIAGGIVFVLALSEIVHLSSHHQHSLVHFAGDFGALNIIGQISFMLAALLLL